MTLILESIFKLVYPFDTSIYTTVSNVTEDMLEIAEAPFPVIIGCLPEVYKSIPSYKLASMKSETVIINLDDNRIGWKNKVEFPKSQLSYLTTKLEDLRNSVNKIQDFNLDGYIDLTQDSLRSIKLQVMVNLEINMKIKKIFVNLMILIIGKLYFSHLIVPRYQDFYEPFGGEFDFDEYLIEIPKENQDFYKKLLNTQMFRTFIKDSYHENYSEIREFKQYISLIQSNNSKLSSAKKTIGGSSSGE